MPSVRLSNKDSKDKEIGADSLLKVLAQYLFRINGHVPTDWQLKGVAIAGYTVAVLCKFDQLKARVRGSV